MLVDLLGLGDNVLSLLVELGGNSLVLANNPLSDAVVDTMEEAQEPVGDPVGL